MTYESYIVFTYTLFSSNTNTDKSTLVSQFSSSIYIYISHLVFYFHSLSADVVEMKQHNYTKAQIVEIAFQIYVPKGTKLSSTRKSTWLNPIVDGDEAAMIKLSKKINEETKLEKVLEFMSAVKREKVEMEQRAITPDLLPLDAKLNGFEKLNDKPVMKGPQRKKKT